MKAVEILNHFISRANWIDPTNTVDKIIVGDQDSEIHNILVSWISDMKAIKYAIENDFDMLITHEPTFWIHANEIENMSKWDLNFPKREAAFKKKKLVEENRLVILRNHDVWDRMPKVGIPSAWAKFLGFKGEPSIIGAEGYQHRYDIDCITLDELAEKIVQRTAAIGEPFVQVIGDGSMKVSKVGIGTGCVCDIPTFMKMGCDVSIVCDDGSSYWRDLKWTIDINYPVIRVNHATSEEPGMITLTEYINRNIPAVHAVHFAHRSRIRFVGEEG